MDKLLNWMNGERGRRKKLAEACAISHGAVSQWRRVPPERVIAVEKVTGISRYELRPDIYGKRREAAE